MKIPRPPQRLQHLQRSSAAVRALVLPCLLATLAPALHAQRAPVATRALQTLSADSAVETGPISLAQPLTLTLRLQPSATQAAALGQLLSAQLDPASPVYHQWLTPQQFAAQFGPSVDQLASLTTYLQAQGLKVAAISPAHTRLTVTGLAPQVEQAFAVQLRGYNLGSRPFFANAGDPTLPNALAALVAGVSGLDSLPQPASARISFGSSTVAVQPRSTAALATPQRDDLTALAAVVDANITPVLTLSSSACASDLAPSDVDAFRALFRQASAQGITVLATSSCIGSNPDQAAASSSFPAALAEVTSVATAALAPTPGLDPRPTWQAAPGLPTDGLRHEPDLAVSSVAALAQTVATLHQQTGNRLGNLNATLYALAKTPGLFTQPDTPSGTGNWEPATGLGLIDLDTLLKVYPRGLTGVTVDFQSSTYSVNYGTPFTLNAVVNPNTFNTAAPTGTVTFTSSTQGVLGSVAVSNGTASLTPGVLPVGTYTITATYSGDGNYAAASKGGVSVYVAIVNAGLQAMLSPSVSVPYGATATVTATVTLPGSTASPTGDVYAQIEAVTGASYSATLSPNAGSNSATANIVLSVPSPGSYTVEVSCQGSQNFQCQTPVDLNLRSVKGYTATTLTVNPAAPQAGQPVYITAVVANSGNGKGTYTYGGSIGFFDSGKLIASAPVATNQATAGITLSGTRTHNLTAVYSGDTNWNGSTSGAVAVLPTILPTSLTLSTNTNGFGSLAGVNVIFTATVTTNVNYGTGPTGYITLFDTYNGAVIQLGNAAALVANGPDASIATFTSTGLLPGLHHIYARYTGDDDYAAVTSGVTTLSISDFNVTMNPSTLTVTRGQVGSVSALVGASGGFTGTVTLGCSPPGNSEATCTISPAAVSVGQTATLTITTTAAKAAPSPQQARSLRGWTAATGASLGLLLVVVPGLGRGPGRGRRRRPLPTLLLVLVAVSLTANLGCAIGTTTTSSSVSGGSGSTPPSDPGTPLGTENFTITASGSDGVNTARHTYPYQVTVQ